MHSGIYSMLNSVENIWLKGIFLLALLRGNNK